MGIKRLNQFLMLNVVQIIIGLYNSHQKKKKKLG